MRQFVAEIEIAGSAADVWAVITDAASYPDWDPNMNRIEGSVGLNEKLVLHTTLSKRSFTVSVSELTPNSRMVWKSGLPLGLFKGVRTFQITPRGDSVLFRLDEVFSGPMSPLFGRMIPDLHPTFVRFVRGLKARVEGRADDAELEPTP